MKNEIMGWTQCEREFIRKVDVDAERVSSLRAKAFRRLKRARNSTDIDFAVEDYYETIKELLTAYLLQNGMRSSNHQCLISFFLHKNRECEHEALLIQQMSFYRNRLNYYGEDIPEEFYSENKESFEKIIKYIMELLEHEKKR